VTWRAPMTASRRSGLIGRAVHEPARWGVSPVTGPDTATSSLTPGKVRHVAGVVVVDDDDDDDDERMNFNVA